jgi:NAD(P)-dependent dehydrogenase (short-subunit alcohol dehydrogenase family)
VPSVLVTGASRGFGRELADEYGRRGWTVFALVRKPKAVRLWDQDAAGWCHPICADVGLASVEKAIGTTLAARGDALDLLINNAGEVRKRRWLAETTSEDIEDLFRVHCLGAFRCTRAALPFLRRGRNPTVVNITSRFGSMGRMTGGGFRGVYSYSIAKCAQNMLTACLDQELRQEGLRVLAVHPGQLRTSVAAADADTEPHVAAVKLADWLESLGRDVPCGLHDLMAGSVIPW